MYAGHPSLLFGSRISGRIRSQLMGKLAGGAEFQILLATDFCSQLDKSRAKAAGKENKNMGNREEEGYWRPIDEDAEGSPCEAIQRTNNINGKFESLWTWV